jgi:hypothetical protein
VSILTGLGCKKSISKKFFWSLSSLTIFHLIIFSKGTYLNVMYVLFYICSVIIILKYASLTIWYPIYKMIYITFTIFFKIYFLCQY